MDMLKRIEEPTNNIYNGVEFILRGAKKRRSMAMASARMMNAEQGIQQKLVAVKQTNLRKKHTVVVKKRVEWAVCVY